MSTLKWFCDSCEKGSDEVPWKCPGCGKEVCNHCFQEYNHCASCCKGRTSEELRLAANAEGAEFLPDVEEEKCNENS